MAEAAAIEFVYFDLGNVLVAFDPQIACGNLARLFGVSAKAAEAAVYESGLQARFECGEIDAPEFAERLRRELGLNGGVAHDDAICDAASDMFTPVDAMRLFAEQVRRSGIPVGVLSNTCVAHWRWIERQSYAVMQIEFDAVILSYEVGAMKPDAAIYERAERAAGVAGERILFLDDRIENVEGARRRGWWAEPCLSVVDAEQILRRYGLLM